MSVRSFYYDNDLNNDSTSIDNSDPLERYLKNNHLTFKPPVKKENKDQKVIRFNNQNLINPSRNSVSKLPQVNKPINQPTVLNKPPKYNPIPKPVPDLNKENIQLTSSKEKLFSNLKDYKPNNDYPLDSSIIVKNESLEDILSNSESDEDIRNESRDLKNLRNKISELRKKLFDEIKQSKEMLNDGNKSENEIELSIGDGDGSSSEESDLSNIESINLKNKKIAIQPKKVTFPEQSFKNSKKQFGIDSIDLRAQNLIDKSEDSLSEKIVSSDGLTSSSYSSSISSSCSTIVNDTDIYQPEFLKYLENKTKPGNEPTTGEPLKPENDILYQWRLRRKLEEAKITEPSNSTLISIQVPQNQTNSFEKHDIPKKEGHVTKKDENEVEIKPKINLKNSIQTQTLNLVDTQIQTDLDIEVTKSMDTKKSDGIKKKLIKINESLEFEIPTKDNQEIKEVKKSIIKKESHSTPTKLKFTSSSPIKQNKLFNSNEYSQINSNENSTDDLTRVSVITDKTPLSSSISVSKKSKLSNIRKSLDRPSVTSSITSTISSVCSSITNVTDRMSPVHFHTSSVQIVTTEKQPKMEKSLVKKSKSSNNKTKIIESNTSNNISDVLSNVTDEYFNSFDEHDRDLFECDDILRILLKKTYFYQLKLKQIDDLLTS